MSIKEFKLPDPGEGLTEAEIVTWKVKAGDTVKVNDIVVEIETAKSLVELPVPFAGTVTQLLVSEGETVEVGTPIIAVDTTGGAATTVQEAPSAGAVEPGIEGSPAPKMAAAAAAAEEEIEEGKIGGTTSTGRTAVLVGYGVKQTEAKRRPRRAGAQPEAAPAAPVAAPASVAAPAPTAPAAPAAPPCCPRGWRACPGQAPGPQVRQGPRRRPGQRGRVGRGWHHHPRRRRGPRGRDGRSCPGSCRRSRQRQAPPRHTRPLPSPARASGSSASRSRACAR